MSMKEDALQMKKEVEEIRTHIRDYKKQSKRQFIIILVMLALWFASIGLFIYYINTTGYEVVTETAETTDSGNACVGDNCNNGEINYGKGDKNN